MLASIVLAILAMLCPGGEPQKLPPGAKAEMPVPARAVCRMVPDDTTTVVCAWRTTNGHLRLYRTTS